MCVLLASELGQPRAPCRLTRKKARQRKQVCLDLASTKHLTPAFHRRQGGVSRTNADVPDYGCFYLVLLECLKTPQGVI